MNALGREHSRASLIVGWTTVPVVLATLAAGGATLAVRSAVNSFASESFRKSESGKRILAGGAPLIGGTPRRPDSGFREILEWEVTQNIPLRIPALYAASRIERLIGWNVPLLQGQWKPFRAGGGFLAFANYRSPETRERDAARYLHLVRWLEQKGLSVLCVFPPARFASSEVFYDGVFDFRAEQDSALAGFLASNAIEVLDLRLLAEHEGIVPRSTYYATDLHFNETTAHWAAKAISARLSDSGIATGFGPDPPDGSLWREVADARPFLGSIGRRTSLAWCSPETMRFPELDPPGRFSIVHENFRGVETRAEGGFECLFDEKRIRSTFGLYRRNPYDAFSYGSGRRVEIRNERLPDAPRLLFVADSFDNEILVYLAPSCSVVTSVDGRNGDVDLASVIRNGSFDAAVLLFHAPPSENHISCLELSP